MDPNATLEMLLDGIAVDDTEKVSEAAETLSQWISRGGFLPTILENWARHLKWYAKTYAADRSVDFRFYLRENGEFRGEVGDPSYDLDHSGYCGAGSIAAGATLDDCRKAVAACLDDAVEFYFCGR